ncbi:MAG: type IV toxin-antitoxin system AbiEi family antitoxin domain-containing protein [Acidimicrobiia bacterium]
MDFSPLARVAATQHGLLTSADFTRAGISRRQVDALVRSGFVTALHRGVWRVSGAAPPRLQRYGAALMAVGEGSALSHRSGMAVWTVPGIEVDSLEVTVPRQRVHRIDGLVVHRSTDLRDHHLRTHAGLVVTSPARTLVDIAGCLWPATVDRVLESWLTRKLVTIEEIEDTIDEIARQGRPGSAGARAMLQRRALGRSIADSNLEVITARLLERAGLEVVHHHLVMIGSEIVAELDFAFPAERMYLESDGFGAHTTRRAFDRDRTRQNLLTELGWAPVRFSDGQLRFRGMWCMRSTQRNLAARRRELGLRNAS